MEFKQLQEALNASLAWSDDPQVSIGGNFRKRRAFLLPPEWEGSFYEQTLVQAFAHTFPLKTENPQEKYMARVVVSSGRATSIDIEGPWEDFDKAQRRLEGIIASLDMKQLPPSFRDIQQIAKAHSMWATAW